VTRPAKINHVGTLKYLRIINLKNLMPYNFSAPDSNHIRFTQEFSRAIATSKQSYNYLLFEFADFSQTFSDVAQNITSATYKEVGGWEVGWGGGCGWGTKVTFQTQWDQLLCQRSCQWSPNHTTRQSRPSDNSHG